MGFLRIEGDTAPNRRLPPGAMGLFPNWPLRGITGAWLAPWGFQNFAASMGLSVEEASFLFVFGHGSEDHERRVFVASVKVGAGGLLTVE